MRKTGQKGFTLIEWMLVVVIGILAAIAVPAYRKYAIRAQVTEGLTVAGGWKAAIAEYYTNQRAWPALANLTGSVTSTSKYVSAVTVLAGGVIQVTYGLEAHSSIAAKVLEIGAFVSANNDVIWICGKAPIPPGVAIAPGSVFAATSTTVPAEYLPTACHG